MNILFCHHGSICEPGIIRALENMGHTLTICKEDVGNPETNEVYMNCIAGQLQKQPYDMVFSVNFIPIISRVCEKYQMPYFCWIVDSPVIQLYSDTLLNQCNYVFVFDYTLYAEFVERNPEHIFYLPLGCDLELYDQIQVSGEEQKLYGSDVSFVGSLYSEKCMYNTLKERLPNYLQGYFDGILNAQRTIYGYNFLREILSEDVVKVLEQCISINQGIGYEIDTRTLFGNLVLNPKCTEMERIHLLNAIAEKFSVTLYTNSDTSKLQGVNCKGVVSSLDGMPKVFKSSKINLNLTAKGIQSGASLRIYDVLGCGGFLLSNYQAELPEQFEIGKEIVLFESEKDLLEKIAYYLEHEEEREEIARNGYEKVKNHYTYRKRLEEMFSHYTR